MYFVNVFFLFKKTKACGSKISLTYLLFIVIVLGFYYWIIWTGAFIFADSSAAAELQAALLETKVVKAFNTTFGGTLASGKVADSHPTTVLMASDYEAAKQTLAAALENS